MSDKKRVTAQAQRDALLLILYRQWVAEGKTPGALMTALDAALAKPGPEPTPEELRWVEAIEGYIVAVLANRKEGDS